jgi:hypothetical protein
MSYPTEYYKGSSKLPYKIVKEFTLLKTLYRKKEAFGYVTDKEYNLIKTEELNDDNYEIEWI